MKEIFDNIVYIYNQLMSYGINPISIVSVVLITHILKSNIKALSNAKHKKIIIMVLALVLGVASSLVFLWIAGKLDIKLIVLNSIINTIASEYSYKIIKTVDEKIKGKK